MIFFTMRSDTTRRYERVADFRPAGDKWGRNSRPPPRVLFSIDSRPIKKLVSLPTAHKRNADCHCRERYHMEQY
jgi:hypothetical protein